MSAMTTAIKQQPTIGQLDRGDWLVRLLADVRADVAHQPSANALERMGRRVYEGLKQPTRAAA
jgi:hypothetical protein